MQKMLLVDQEKCTGCRTCEAVCSAKHEGASNPSRSRIQVVKWEWEGFMLPFMCQQCRDAPCVTACPVKALGRDDALGQVEVDYDLCIGCKLCINVCPFGGMGYDPIDNKVIKCDFCGGDPLCVRFCSTGAITFVNASEASLKKKKEALLNLPELIGKYAAHSV